MKYETMVLKEVPTGLPVLILESQNLEIFASNFQTWLLLTNFKIIEAIKSKFSPIQMICNHHPSVNI